jgi:PTS system nitrogen regulatory IIA component
MRRESEGSTAIGGGLVIPHARFKGLDQVHIGVATLRQPLQLPAEDGQPVDVTILLLGPGHDTRQMLRVLARLARLVKRDAFLTGLREADSPARLRDAFSRVDLNA